MTHRSRTGRRFSKRTALALVAGALMSLGSPVVAASSAAEQHGRHRPVPATFGDCKNANSGVHNGYDCQVVVVEEQEEEGGDV
jgi:hypothetical protein